MPRCLSDSPWSHSPLHRGRCRNNAPLGRREGTPSARPGVCVCPARSELGGRPDPTPSAKQTSSFQPARPSSVSSRAESPVGP